MTFLDSLSPAALAELEAFVDARVTEALALRDRERDPKGWLSVREAAELEAVVCRCRGMAS